LIQVHWYLDALLVDILRKILHNVLIGAPLVYLLNIIY
jgi:hypothetical protein